MTVFVYVNSSKQVGDPEHIKVFATTDAAETWFAEIDPEGVAFEYEVLVRQVLGSFWRKWKPRRIMSSSERANLAGGRL
jgi:hypothetical protein